MSFKFNFVDTGESGEERNRKDHDDNITQSDSNVSLRQLEEIYPIKIHEIRAESYSRGGKSCSPLMSRQLQRLKLDENVILHHVSPSVVEEQLKTESFDPENVILKAILRSSDLVPGEYEGGLKLWECTEDLLKYMKEIDLELTHKRVLELGCGSGLLGIYALLRGSVVHFQDYNREVLEMVTIPNVLINRKMTNGSDRCRYFAGDWSELPNFLGRDLSETEKYDLILTSETIYNTSNYGSLVSIFKHCLKCNGKIFLAAKSVYFGVGGSVESFKSFVVTTRCFDLTTCKVSTQDLRKPYRSSDDRITEEGRSMKDPIGLFTKWFEEAKLTPGVLQPNAMCLSTAAKSGIPSSRMVLMKAFGKEGFQFFTNYTSRKGTELSVNPNASLLFYWDPLDRQVRIEGYVEKLSAEESERYFHSRPRPSQISACISKQSSVVKREELLKKFEVMSVEYCDETIPIPKPDNWGGFLLVPRFIEFFQGQSNRLHDRIRFRRPEPGEEPDDEYVYSGDDGWVYERLSP